MTVQPTFFDWVNSGINWDAPPHESCSPNLMAIKAWLDGKYQEGTFLGCHNDRDIRDGSKPSEHSWGAAMDWSYEAGKRIQTADYLISISAELGICAIHDYVGCRIWRAGRYPGQDPATWWKAQTPNTGNGMGQAWATYFHLVTTKDQFHNTTPVPDRLRPLPEDVDMIYLRRSYRAHDSRPGQRQEPSGPAQVRLTPGENNSQGRKVPLGLALTYGVRLTVVNAGGPGFVSVTGDPGIGDPTVNMWDGKNGDGTVTITTTDGHCYINTTISCDIVVDVTAYA